MMQQQNAYIESLEGLQREVRRFRHDYKNMMAGMYAQAKEGDADAVRQLIWEVTDDFESQVGGWIQEMTQLGNVHMMEVKGLLLGKAEEMKKERIAFELEVFRPFLKTGMRGTDLCRCLGILLDNAIDACMELPPKERLIRLFMEMKGNYLYLVLTNTAGGGKKKHFGSSRGEGHGFGLSRLDEAVRRNGGYVIRASEDNAFSTEILLPQ